MEKKLNVSHRAMPVFADRSMTASQISAQPDEKKKGKAKRKEGTIRLLFVDSVSNAVVADVVMTSIAAKQLIAGIEKSVDKLAKDIADPALPQRPAKQEHHNYIG